MATANSGTQKKPARKVKKKYNFFGKDEKDSVEYQIVRTPVFRKRPPTTLVDAKQASVHWSNEANEIRIDAVQIYGTNNGDDFRTSLSPRLLVRALLEVRPEVLTQALAQVLGNALEKKEDAADAIAALVQGLVVEPRDGE